LVLLFDGLAGLDEGLNGGFGDVAGDLVFVIKEKKHDVFTREGVINLYIEKEIPLVNALTGFQFYITHLDGRKILVKTNPGDILKPDDEREIRNEGMPIYSRPYEKGNLIIKFKLIFPDKLNTNQIGEIRKALPGYCPPPQKNPEAEEAVLTVKDPYSAGQEGYHSKSKNAYDSDSDGEAGGNPGVQCSQQ